MSTKDKNSRSNLWKPPVEGLEFDLEGPSADYLLDMSHIYDQTVYQDVHAVKEEWSLVAESEASSYLPTKAGPKRVTLGIKEKKTTDIPFNHAIKLDDYFEFKKGFVINTGGSIWGLDFVPKSYHDSDPTTQYLAVAGYKDTFNEHHPLDELQPTGSYKNAVQIWKLKLSSKQPSEDPVLDMCLLHDFGVIHDLKWCPYGVYEDEEVNDGLPKLGILALACGDGTLRTIVVPHPNAVRKHMCPENVDPLKTLYLRIESSRCTFAIAATKALVISWGGHKKIAGGYTNGVTAVWDMESALGGDGANTVEESKKYLQLSFSSFDAGIRCITWRGHDDPDRLLIAGYDGKLITVDINDPFMYLVVNRARAIMSACAWAGHSTMMLFCDGESMAKGFSYNMDSSFSSAKFAELAGLCWTMATSEFHGQFACGTAIGYVYSCNMYQVKSRMFVNAVNVVHKLCYNEVTNEYRYVDGLGVMTMNEAKALPTYTVYGKTHRAIQRVIWNPNRPTCGFLASGGSSGLCRIEFEGRGSKWV